MYVKYAGADSVPMTSSSTAGSGFGWVSVGVMVLSAVTYLMGKNRHEEPETRKVETKVHLPGAEAHRLPRVYGTNKVKGYLVWYGNIKMLDTKASDSTKTYY